MTAGRRVPVPYGKPGTRPPRPPGRGRREDSALGREHAVRREAGYGYTPQSKITTPLATDWEAELGRLARATAELGPVSQWPVWDGPCEIVLTSSFKRHNTLTVRCRCMAGTIGRPSPRFYGYDPVGEAGTIEGALAVWKAHRAQREQGEDHDRREDGSAAA